MWSGLVSPSAKEVVSRLSWQESLDVEADTPGRPLARASRLHSALLCGLLRLKSEWCVCSPGMIAAVPSRI